MKGSFLQSAGLYLDLGETTLKALHAEQGLELPLERQPNGRLTEPCKARVIEALQKFLQRRSWQPRVRAWCAFGARGVSLRRLALPAAKEEFQRLLRMQIESEFPLTPDELAWGYQTLGEIRQNGFTKHEVLVAAVRKDVVEDYAEMLSRSGINAVFTPAALARRAFCSRAAGNCAMLDLGRNGSELLLLENGIPASLRVAPWGVEQLKPGGASPDAAAKTVNGALAASLAGKTVFVSGDPESADLCPELGRRLGADCEPLKVAPGPGHSAAVFGLKQSDEHGQPLLLLQSRQSEARNGLAQPVPVKLAAAAAALLLAVLLLPYAQAILLKPILARRLDALNSQTNRLDTISRELNFLQSLKQSQPPYLDALYLFSKFRPEGAHIDSLAMNRHGEVSLRGSMRNADQVSEFRSKLIASGFFYVVAVEEQAPTPDRQKVNVRVTALWKPYSDRQALAIGPTADEIEKSKNRKDAPGGGGMPPGFMPGGMPMGMPMGMPQGMPPAGARPTRARPPSGAMPAGLPPGVELPPGFTPGMPAGGPPPQKEGND